MDMCKRFHVYYKPLSPILQEVLFPVYPGSIFIFLATVYKRRPFAFFEKHLFSKKAAVQAAPMLQARTKRPSTSAASSTIITALLLELFCFLFRFILPWPFAELL